MSGINIRDMKKFWESGFSIKHYLAGEFYKDRIFLCGDAAHVMSPIGGQNMNTGFADAELAVWSVKKILKEAGNAKHISSLYTGLRRRASIVATKRAAMMTNLGTSGGHFWSALRNGFTFLLLHLPVKKYLASFFTMQTIPYRNIEVSMKKLKGVSKL